MSTPTGLPAADIAQTAIGLGESVAGLINAKKTKEEADRLSRSRPKYNISPFVGEDLSLTKSDLAQGMSTAAESAYRDLDNSQFSASLGAILKGGGGVNNVGDVYGNNQEGRLKLAMVKDQLRLQQIQNLMRASSNMQQEQQTAWQLNEFAPWEDKAQANAQARMNAQKQIWEGLGVSGSGIMQGFSSMREQNQFNPQIHGMQDNSFNNGYATNIPTTSSQQYPNSNVLTERANPSPNTNYPTSDFGNISFYGTKY